MGIKHEGFKFRVGDTMVQTKYVKDEQNPRCLIIKIESKTTQKGIFLVHHQHAGEKNIKKLKGNVDALNSFFTLPAEIFREPGLAEAIDYAITTLKGR